MSKLSRGVCTVFAIAGGMMWAAASAQSIVVVGRAGIVSAVSPTQVHAPDFNGDGVPDHFEIVETAGKDNGRGHSCLQVALSVGANSRARQQSLCGDWRIVKMPAPGRGVIRGRESWVVRLVPSLKIPDFGHPASSRDAVLLRIDDVPSLLFLHDRQYILHQQVDIDRIIFEEGVAALSRFEQG
jgi:hypothetical protein